MGLLQQLGFEPQYLGPFGDLRAVTLTPVLQQSFWGGINVQTGVAEAQLNGGTVDTSNGRLRLQTGTNSAGSAVYHSMFPLKYKEAQGIIARWTPMFDDGADNSLQVWGIGSATNGYFFARSGRTFGILHRNNSASGSFIPNDDWNGEKLDRTLAPRTRFNWVKSYGLPVQVVYPYLGYGDVTFWASTPGRAGWTLAHTIAYENTTNVLQVGHPNLFFRGEATNSGNNTNLTMYCGSVGCFLVGERSYTSSPKWSYKNNKSAITSETSIFALRNCNTYNGAAHAALVRLESVSFSTQANTGVANFWVTVAPVAALGGTPAFAAYNGTTADNGVTITSGNSLVAYDTAGTTVGTSGVIKRWGVQLKNPGDSGLIDVREYGIFVPPGYVAIFSGESTNASQLGAHANWAEDL